MSSSQLTERRLGKYGKTLIGRTDMEDGLKKLDKLTQEEARMAIAEVLKATHAVGERVMGVANTVAAIDNSVADVNDRVARVDGLVAGVDVRVARVNDRVAGVDDRVARTAHVIEDWVRGAREQELVADDRVANIDDPVEEVINGARIILSQAQQIFNWSHADGNALTANQVTKQIANDVDQVDRSSSSNFMVLAMDFYTSFQKTDRGRTSTNGSPHRIRRLIITLRVILITRKPQRGSFKATFSANGNQQARYFGSMGNVRSLPLLTGYPLMRS